jgi:hypothetical protein
MGVVLPADVRPATQVAQTCLTNRSNPSASRLFDLNYTGLVYALAFGVFIFGEHYPAQTIVGSAWSLSAWCSASSTASANRSR